MIGTSPGAIGTALAQCQPRDQPRQLGKARAEAGFGHLGQPEVNRIGQDGGQQQVLLFDRLTVLPRLSSG
jgi:hypothetical protein